MDHGTGSVVQHISRASSDQLLHKFADLGDNKGGIARRALAVVVIRRCERSRENVDGHRIPASDVDDVGGNVAVLERKSLLSVRPIGRGRMSRPVRGRDCIKHKWVIGAIQKTWRKTVRGATRMLIEKHHNRHRRLINDTATTIF